MTRTCSAWEAFPVAVFVNENGESLIADGEAILGSRRESRIYGRWPTGTTVKRSTSRTRRISMVCIDWVASSWVAHRRFSYVQEYKVL